MKRSDFLKFLGLTPIMGAVISSDTFALNEEEEPDSIRATLRQMEWPESRIDAIEKELPVLKFNKKLFLDGTSRYKYEIYDQLWIIGATNRQMGYFLTACFRASIRKTEFPPLPISSFVVPNYDD